MARGSSSRKSSRTGVNKVNPFENRTRTTSKSNIVGRKVKNVTRSASSGKTRAVAERKKLLLNSFARFSDNSTGELVDRRFGENNSLLSQSEKDNLRLRRQREKEVASSRDSEIMCVDDLMSKDEEDDKWSYLATKHPDAPRSKKEIMHEVIQKSKAHKVENTMHVERQRMLAERLDSEFGETEFRNIMAAASGPRDRGTTDDYDVLLRELSREATVQATERTKTPEEIAEEEFKRLNVLEEERLRRKVMPDVDTQDTYEPEVEADEVDSIEIDPEFVLSNSDCEEVPDLDMDMDLEPEMVLNNSSNSRSSDIPFVFEMPEDLEKFLALVDGYSIEDVNVVVQRVRACHDISLNPSVNRQLLLRFLSILLEYMELLVSGTDDLDEIEEHLKLFNLLGGHIYEIGCQQKNASVGIVRKHIGHMYLLTMQEDCYPTAGELAMLSAFTHIFPTTDFDHPISTIVWMYASDILQACTARCSRDLLVGLYICDLLLSSIQDSDRLVPQVISYLCGVITVGFLGDTESLSQAEDRFCFKNNFMSQLNSSLAMNEESVSSWTEVKASLLTLWLNDNDDFFDSIPFQHIIASVVIQLIEKSLSIWRNNVAFSELISPLLSITTRWASATNGTHALNSKLNTIISNCTAASISCTKSRQPLYLKKKVVCIRELEPVFEAEQMNKETVIKNKKVAALKTMKKQLRREKSGARKELRRDTMIIHEEKTRQSGLRDKRLEAKAKEEQVFLQNQSRDSNQLRRLTNKDRNDRKRAENKM